MAWNEAFVHILGPDIPPWEEEWCLLGRRRCQKSTSVSSDFVGGEAGESGLNKTSVTLGGSGRKGEAVQRL